MMSTLSWLNAATLTMSVIVTSTLLAAGPVQAQAVTVLRGAPPVRPAASIDCNNPYYAQYCQAYEAWQQQYYPSYDYDDGYPYYGYGLPVGVGLGFGFIHNRGDFHNGFRGRFGGGFRGEGFHSEFHGGGFSGGGFRAGGFHGGFHGGGFHGGGLHGGGGHR